MGQRPGTHLFLSFVFISHFYNFSLLSFSSLLFFFLNPRPPFTAFNQKELAGKIREGRFRRIPYRYSDGLNDLITRMLNLKVMVARHHVYCLSLCELWRRILCKDQ